jgi:protein-L-isoaspartate(D-aspartate) O-methyltransferase
MIDWEPLAKQLADAIAAETELEPVWRAVFEQTPRHVFVPRFWGLDGYNRPAELVDGADPDQQERWLDACYSNRVLITQWCGQNGRRIITSSGSMPSLVAEMLQALDVHDGNKVLEIGTGTGYNTALLCHRLGDKQVATVDIDPVLVAEAQSRLNRLGHDPTAEAGDGADGLPVAAPYDRILSTCSAASVPTAWINQLADGGLIVAPLTFGGALAVLRKTGLGEVSGRLATEQAYFMPLHEAGQPMPDGYVVDLPQPAGAEAHYRSTIEVPPTAWADPDFRLWLAIHLPEGHLADLVDDDLNRTGVVVYTTTSRASVDYTAGEVAQDQERLWDVVEAAWLAWQRHGQPGRTRLGITARLDRQWVWLDDPDQPLPAATPGGR